MQVLLGQPSTAHVSPASLAAAATSAARALQSPVGLRTAPAVGCETAQEMNSSWGLPELPPQGSKAQQPEVRWAQQVAHAAVCGSWHGCASSRTGAGLSFAKDPIDMQPVQRTARGSHLAG